MENRDVPKPMWCAVQAMLSREIRRTDCKHGILQQTFASISGQRFVDERDRAVGVRPGKINISIHTGIDYQIDVRQFLADPRQTLCKPA